MDIKGSSGEGPDRLRSTEKKASIVLENTCITWSMLVEMSAKDTPIEVSEGKEKCFWNWRKGNPCYKVAENLAEMCYVGWKAELVWDKLGYSDEISKQSVKGVGWFS